MKRQIISSALDLIAIFAFGCAFHVATGSIYGAIAGQILVGAYGCWCFYDGKTRKDM